MNPEAVRGDRLCVILHLARLCPPDCPTTPYAAAQITQKSLLSATGLALQDSQNALGQQGTLA